MKKIVILGCENSHADGFLNVLREEELPLEVLGVYSDESDAAKRVSEKFGVPILQHFDDAVGKVDGVMITARHGGRHFPLAAPYLPSGVPLFIDKPFSCSLADGRAFCEELKKYKNPVCGGSVMPKIPDVRTLRDTVACSGIGEIVGGSLIFPTFTDSPYGGYKFYASHMLETAMFLFGKDIRGVSASIMGKNMYCELIYDSFRVQSTMSDLRYYFSACIIGKHGTVEKKPILPSDMGKYELAEFSALLDGKAPKQTPDELLFPVRLIDAIDRALESGKSEAVL